MAAKQWIKKKQPSFDGDVYVENVKCVLSLTEEQVKVNLFRARQKVKQRFIDIEGYGL